jgi:hypothetical protein
MRAVGLAILILGSGCSGGDKNVAEELEEACLEACGNYIGFVERCTIELGVATDGYCEDTCSESVRLASEGDCNDEYKA